MPLKAMDCSGSPPTPTAWPTNLETRRLAPAPIKEMQRNWIRPERKGARGSISSSARISERWARGEGPVGDGPACRPVDDVIRRLHDPARHALRRDLHGPRPRASPGGPPDQPGTAGGPSPPIARPPPSKSDLDRTDLARTKTGVAHRRNSPINPVNGEKNPRLGRRLRS